MKSSSSYRSSLPISPLLLVLVMMVGFSIACSVSLTDESTATPEPTVTEELTPTDTKIAKPTKKSLPSSTPTIKEVPTDRPDYAATDQAHAAEAITAEIENVLSGAGSSTDNGHLVYAKQAGTTLTVKGYNTYKYLEVDGTQNLADFAVYSRVTWNTELGFSGCGWLYHVEQGDFQRGRRFYFLFARLSGAPYFFLNRLGGSAPAQVGGGFSNSIDYADGAQNEVLLIVKKTETQIFFNGTKVKTFYDGYAKNGTVAHLAATESGNTECVFENTWIWSWDM
jgi:hypothetical protein